MGRGGGGRDGNGEVIGGRANAMGIREGDVVLKRKGERAAAKWAGVGRPPEVEEGVSETLPAAGAEGVMTGCGHDIGADRKVIQGIVAKGTRRPRIVDLAKGGGSGSGGEEGGSLA